MMTTRPLSELALPAPGGGVPRSLACGIAMAAIARRSGFYLLARPPRISPQKLFGSFLKRKTYTGRRRVLIR